MAINLDEQKPKQNKRSNQTSSVKSLHFLAQDLEKIYKFLHVLMCNVKSESLQLRYGKLRGAACSEQRGGMIQADGHIC